VKIFLICLIGTIGWGGLSFKPMWPGYPSPYDEFFATRSEADSLYFETASVMDAPINQSSEEIGPDFGNSLPKFKVRHPEIVWATPTNQPRKMLWVYKAAPQNFSAITISNIMSMGNFTVADEQNGNTEISSTNENTLFFFNKKRECNLTVVPLNGWIEYWDNYAPANHWDKTNHLWEQVAGVPNDAKTKKLGLQFLKHFGIGPADLAQDSKGHLITFNEKQTRGYFDRRRGKYIDDEVIARGINFDRRIDGVNFAGIGVGGGCEILFGNRARIAKFELVWRNLKPYKKYRIASPDEIMSYILNGRAVLTHKNLVNPADVKKLTITDCSPLYMGANGDETQDLVYPFAQVEAVANLGTNSLDIQLYCPILSGL